MKRLCLVSSSSVLVLWASLGHTQGIPVFDAANLVQNGLQAVQTVIMVRNQIAELVGLEEIVMGDDMAAEMDQLGAIFSEASALGHDLRDINNALQFLFDIQHAPSNATQLRDGLAFARLYVNRAYRDATQVEQLLLSSVSALQHMAGLMATIEAFAGNNQANQTMTQLQSKLTIELMKLRTQTQAHNAARAYDAMEARWAQESIARINAKLMEDYPQ